VGKNGSKSARIGEVLQTVSLGVKTQKEGDWDITGELLPAGGPSIFPGTSLSCRGKERERSLWGEGRGRIPSCGEILSWKGLRLHEKERRRREIRLVGIRGKEKLWLFHGEGLLFTLGGGETSAPEKKKTDQGSTKAREKKKER